MMANAQLDSEASEWFLLHQAGRLTRVERRAFEDWLLRSPEAHEAYRYAERAWRLVGGGEEDQSGDIRRISPSSWRWTNGPGRIAMGALSASVALAFITLPAPLSRFVDIQLAPTRGGGEVLITNPTQRISTRLVDGTIVALDGGTRLRVLEMGAQRRIELLAGHAFFKVAKDPTHPFLVTAMNKTVHAIGTAFDVRVEPNAVAVTLVEGKVRVDQSRGLLRDPIATDMTPGKQLIAADDQVWLMNTVNPVEATSWLKGRLTYTGSPIVQIVADVNEGSAKKIVFSPALDGDQRIVGGFKPGDVDTLASILEVKGIAHVVSRSDREIVMAPGEEPSAAVPIDQASER